jgi:type 1 fimbria pilin
MMALATMLLAVAEQAAACVRLRLDDQVDELVRTVPNLDRPDQHFSGTGATLPDSYLCPPGQEEFLVSVNLSGLTYERDISYAGLSVPAYSLGPRSPLVIFLHGVRGSSGSGGSLSAIPLRNGVLNRNPGTSLTSASTIEHYIQLRIFFRGGAMESVPRSFLGTVETWPVSNPANPFRHSFTVEFTVPPVTCTLANASHTLDDVLANELAASGSNAKESSFDVTMNCPMDNIDVQLSLADANDPGSRNGQLALAPGATAGGVQVQLLRGGQPVQFGQAWSHGWSSKGQQAIPFSARYLRTADPLVPGDVKGEAVLTADYR